MTKYYQHNGKNVAVILPALGGGRAIIGEAEWASLSIADQLSVSTALVGYGYTVETTPSLSVLTSPLRILKDIKDMKDVRSSLDILGLSYDMLTFTLPVAMNTEKARFAKNQADLQEIHDSYMGRLKDQYSSGVSSVVEELTKLLPPYPFIENTVRPKKALSVGNGQVGNGSYNIPLDSARKIFDYAVSVWGKYSDPKSVREESKYFTGIERYGSHRHVYIFGRSVMIGCQTIHRWQAEELGRQMGWDFTQKKDDVE